MELHREGALALRAVWGGILPSARCYHRVRVLIRTKGRLCAHRGHPVSRRGSRKRTSPSTTLSMGPTSDWLTDRRADDGVEKLYVSAISIRGHPAGSS
jgi:hypothetical protein